MASTRGTLISDNLFGYAPGELVAVGYIGGKIDVVRRIAPAELPAVLAAAGSGLTDARGRLVLPGLIDAHIHALASGMLMLSTDLHATATLDELADAVRGAAADGGEFVRLGGLDPSRLGAAVKSIDRAWLDRLLPDRSLYIKSVEGHSAWFNTRAWQRIGVDDVLARLNVPVTTQREMHSTGRVYGNAYEHLTTPLYDSYSFDERRAGLELVIARAKQAGLTGLHCLEGYGEHRRHDFELVLDRGREGDIDLTLYCRDETPELALELGARRFGGCWCVDGAIAAHSAALAEPYADKPDCDGELYFGDIELRHWIEAGLKEWMQICLHAIGERALDQALRCFEALSTKYDLRAMRPRLDHFVMGTPQLAERAARLGVISCMQPAFDAHWGGAGGGYAARLGPERALRTNPIGWMLKHGLRVAGGSDSYITPLDGLAGIRAAMRHHNPRMRVDFETAVNLFTREAAFFSHDEETRGTIAPKCQADFTVVAGDRNLASGASIAMTIKGGDVVYEAGEGMGRRD